MNEPKNFLTRWSERKLAPEEKTASDSKEAAPPVTDKSASVLPAPEAEFDISTLPSLDSITASSDVRAFLQRGVPAELTRAALRRAWSGDPAIRDFVGLSENSWDFNAPDSIPGFASSLRAGELKNATAQLIDDLAKETERRPVPGNTVERAKTPEEMAERVKPQHADASAAEQQSADAATQHDETAETITSSRQPRRHGGALPE